MSPGTDMYALYEVPAPDAVAGDNPAQRGTNGVKIVSVAKSGNLDVVTIEELLRGDEFSETPVALAPGRPIPTVPAPA